MKTINKMLLIGVMSVLLMVLVSCEKDEKDIKEKYEELKTQYEASMHKIAELSTLEDTNKELESKLYEENAQYMKSLQRITELEAYIKNNKNNDLTEFEAIISELENETIHTMELQEAYDEMEALEDKSFRYLDDGTVLVKNSGESIADKWDEATDINEHYQSIIEKFIKLYDMKKEVISDDDLIEAGFMPEVTFYGFGAIYGDRDELYKSYSRNYSYNRKNLEYIIEKYKNGTASSDEVNEKYMKYKKAKEELTEYILVTVHGDL